MPEDNQSLVPTRDKDHSLVPKQEENLLPVSTRPETLPFWERPFWESRRLTYHTLHPTDKFIREHWGWSMIFALIGTPIAFYLGQIASIWYGFAGVAILYISTLLTIIAIYRASAPRKALEEKDKVIKEKEKTIEELNQSTKTLQKQLEENRSELKIETNELFLIGNKGTTYLITILLTITNTKPENNVIRNCRLLIGKDEGILQENAYIKTVHSQIVTTVTKDIVFSQGIPKDYAVSFAFHNRYVADNSISKLAGEPFTLYLTDSYDVVHTLKGDTPQDLVERMLSIT